MSTLKVILVLIMSLTVSCQSGNKKMNEGSSRKVASEEASDVTLDKSLEQWSKELEHESDEKEESSLKEFNSENNLEKSKFVEYWMAEVQKDEQKFKIRFDKFLNGKIDYMTMVQNLVNQFDVIVKAKTKENKEYELYEIDEFLLLQALRYKFDLTLERLRFGYALLEKAANDDANEKRRVNAILIIGMLKNFLEEKFPTYQLPIYTISKYLSDVNEMLVKENKTQYSIDFSQFDLTDEKYRELKAAPLTGKLLARQEKLRRRMDPVLKNIKKRIAAELGKRQPQSVNNYYFYPSTDTHGTMSGRTFAQGEWAITLDDGPSKYTTQFLANLQGNEKYTFFWLSKLIPSFPAAVEEAKNKGCERASHSMTHANLSVSNETKLTDEIDHAIEIFTSKIARPTMFRCPYGACGTAGREHIAKAELVHIFWNVDSLDWQDKNPASIIERVRDQMKTQKRGIILFHDIHPQGIVATKQILEDIRNSGGTKSIVTVGSKINAGGNCDISVNASKPECRVSP